jgi:hypothetical protein
VPNGVGVRLARNRRSPKRPSEPRLSGVHPEEGEVDERCGQPTFKDLIRSGLGSKESL